MAMNEFLKGREGSISGKKIQRVDKNVALTHAQNDFEHQDEIANNQVQFEDDRDEAGDRRDWGDTGHTDTLATLSCEVHGGPDNEASQEMVYWHDIPSDTKYKSPLFRQDGVERYLTFEPDGGGWNNIRMAMETVIGLGKLFYQAFLLSLLPHSREEKEKLNFGQSSIYKQAIATGRTLVLPPAQRMYLLSKDRGKQKTDFDFDHFFPIYDMARENEGLKVITMQKFLERVAMKGHMRNKVTSLVEFPPENRTDWNGQDVKILKEWLRNVTHTPLWSPGSCMAAFPQDATEAAVNRLHGYMEEASENPLRNHILEHPPPVDSPPMDRLRENLAGRKQLCIYDTKMQSEPVIHFMCYHKMRVRMLVHFYAFLFFEDYREDLWMKRFMRYVERTNNGTHEFLLLSHNNCAPEIIFDTRIQSSAPRHGLLPH